MSRIPILSRPPRGLILVRAGVVAAALLLAVSGPAAAVGPMSDAMWAHFPGANGLDTTGTMGNVRAGFSPGYNVYSTNASSARVAMGTSYAQNDAIWWMAGHGAAGLIQTYNSTNGTTNVWVSNTSANCASPNTCLTLYTSTQMHRIRLAVFMGCDTGDPNGSGDTLQKRMYSNLGADSAIAFTKTIGFSTYTSDYFVTQFAYYTMVQHYNINDGAWSAANDVATLNGGNYNGYDGLTFYGGSVKLYPAAFGS